ncbi:MAG: hypothetical protein ABIP79_01160 [Chitinophagaceae bacterium]
MRKSILTITALFSCIILLSHLISSCKKQIDITDLQLLQQEIPDGFPQPVCNFEDNPLSKEGIELGRNYFVTQEFLRTIKFPAAPVMNKKQALALFNMI